MKIITLENTTIEVTDFEDQSAILELVVEEKGKYGASDNHFFAKAVRKRSYDGSAVDLYLCDEDNIPIGIIGATGQTINESLINFSKIYSCSELKLHNPLGEHPLRITFPHLKHTIDLQPPERDNIEGAPYTWGEAYGENIKILYWHEERNENVGITLPFDKNQLCDTTIEVPRHNATRNIKYNIELSFNDVSAKQMAEFQRLINEYKRG